MTLPRRRHAAARLGSYIRTLPGDLDLRAKLVCCKMIPMGVCGAEVAQVADSSFRSLRSAVYSVIHARCDLGSNASLLFSESVIRGAGARPRTRHCTLLGC